ncbi:MAG: PQQ-binding-like beta-propeller repeat protein [Caldilineaceae bacterium]|nr:PQQ-binding-like beta-propeller repeat protein [Caldilineaceae bacterium]
MAGAGIGCAGHPQRVCTRRIVIAHGLRWLTAGALLLAFWCAAPSPVLAQSGEIWSDDLASPITGLAMSADGQRAAVGTRANEVSVRDAEGNELWTFTADNSITGLAWSEDGRRLAISSEDRFLYLLDGDTGNELGRTKASRTFNTVAISRDGSLVAGASDDMQVYVMDSQGELLWTDERGLGVEAVSIYGAGDDARVVVGADDGRLSVFSRAGRQLLSTRLDYDIKSLAVSRSGGRILAGTTDGSITLINGANGEQIWTSKTDAEITDVAMSGDGQLLMARDERGNVLYLDTDGSVVRRLQQEGEIRQIALTGDGTRLAFGLADGQVQVLDRIQQSAILATAARTRNMAITATAGLVALLLAGVILLIIFTTGGRRMWVQHSVGPRRGLATVWRARFSYLLILPTLLFLLTFNYYPAFSGLYHAFTDWNPAGHSPWVGLENFRFLMTDRFFIASFRNALILVVVSIVKTMTMPLLVAELVFNLKNRYTQYWMRTLFVVPIVLPAVVEILVWNNIYDPAIGLLNEFLELVGRPEWTRVWYGDPKVALSSVLFIGVPWVNAFALLIFYGGLISISDEIIDSSRVDGANVFRRFWNIDLPLLMGQVKLLLILNFINAVQTFELVFLTTGGGPGDSTYVPALELYYMAMRMDRMGVASAIGMILFLIILVGTIINMRYVRTATEFEA